MKKIFLFFLIVFFTMSFVGCNNKTPTNEQPSEKSSVSEQQLKVDYELQEKCGKRSEEWVKKEYKGLGFSYSYKNHYNKKMNKCFVFVKYNDGIYKEVLFDVNENNRFGMFTSLEGLESCFISDKECKTKKDWDKLVKPYMEE